MSTGSDLTRATARMADACVTTLRRLRVSIAMCAALLAIAPAASFATTIRYDITNVSGNTWRYDWSVDNTTLDAPLGEYTIYFDKDAYGNLQNFTAPAGWDAFIGVPEPDYPLFSDGFVDFIALDGSIPTGDTLAGFSLMFDWLVAGTPGSQPFDIINSDPFETIESGHTVPNATGPVGVPEPSSFALLSLGLFGVGFAARRHSNTFSK